jgi:hypothetical protein
MEFDAALESAKPQRSPRKSSLDLAPPLLLAFIRLMNVIRQVLFLLAVVVTGDAVRTCRV